MTGVAADELLTATPGVAASTGSACHSSGTQPSAVLVAMATAAARSGTPTAVRLSLGRWTTADHIEHAAVQLAKNCHH